MAEKSQEQKRPGLSSTCDFPNTEHLKPKTLGEAETEPIGTTSNHPFWSVDRQEFVQAGSLEIGERLQTLSGDVKVVQQKLPRPGPQPVFNLEVHNEHVYFVGKDGVLVHNSGPYSSQKLDDVAEAIAADGRSIRSTAPVAIPNNATRTISTAGSGAQTIRYEWYSRGRKYVARLHEASNVSWVVERIRQGNQAGLRKQVDILVEGHGRTRWITQDRWKQANFRRKFATPSATDLKYLNNGHFEPQ